MGLAAARLRHADSSRVALRTSFDVTALRANLFEQPVDRPDELLDALTLEGRDDVVVIDADGVELVEQVLRLLEIRLEPQLDSAVVLERADRLLRHGRDRLRPDQLLDVERVAQAWVLH